MPDLGHSGSTHCDHCRGLGAAARPSPERNLEIEGFIEDWAKRNGFQTKWPTDRERPQTIVRLA